MTSVLNSLRVAAVLAIAGLPADAAEPSGDRLAPLFASCAGRYAAEMEHEWLVGGSGEAEREIRDRFVTLAEAARTTSDAAMLLDLRIRAKLAQARLLLQSAFHTDRAQARRAAAMARRQTRLCEAMILG